MNIKDVTLDKIAVAGLLFDSLTPYNASLVKFRSATRNRLALDIQEHRDALMDWLNDWGCRHLSKDQHHVASGSILDWYQKHRTILFSDNTPLWRLGEREIETAANAYGSLKDRLGARHSRYDNQLMVHIGPTAASKVLFALRPKALMPWDEAMRKAFGHGDASPESYFKYLVEIRDLALHIEKLCGNKGFQIDDLPGKIDRGGSTVIELLNEYIWVKTRGIKLPSSETLTHWASLG
jgi:hypothetical protein